jgi:hypothetical protein
MESNSATLEQPQTTTTWPAVSYDRAMLALEVFKVLRVSKGTACTINRDVYQKIGKELGIQDFSTAEFTGEISQEALKTIIGILTVSKAIPAQDLPQLNSRKFFPRIQCSQAVFLSD